MNSDFFKLRKDAQYGAYVLLGFLGVLIYDQQYYWKNKEDYSFGYLVPLFVAYVLYERWPTIKQFLIGGDASKTSGKPGGLSMVIGFVAAIGAVLSLLVFALGGALRVQGPANLASLCLATGYGGLVLTMVYFNTDKDSENRVLSLKERLTCTFLFLFPAMAWLVSAPLVMFMEKTVRLILLEYVTVIVEGTFTFLGYSILREGNVLILPEGEVGVADACSGIRSITACIFAGTFLSAVFLNRLWKKVLLVSIAMLLAFITNIGRSLFLTAWAYANGSESINGLVHDVAGYSVLGLTSVMLIALLPIFNLQLIPDDDDTSDGDFSPEQV